MRDRKYWTPELPLGICSEPGQILYLSLAFLLFSIILSNNEMSSPMPAAACEETGRKEGRSSASPARPVVGAARNLYRWSHLVRTFRMILICWCFLFVCYQITSQPIPVLVASSQPARRKGHTSIHTYTHRMTHSALLRGSTVCQSRDRPPSPPPPKPPPPSPAGRMVGNTR